MAEDVIVSPCPFCGVKSGDEAPVCSECRLTYGEHARYTEGALVHYAARSPGYDRLVSGFAKIALYPIERYRRQAVEALRLREGHLAGIRRMVYEDRRCAGIMRQTYAVRHAIRRIEALLLRAHLDTCVAPAVRNGRGGQGMRQLVQLYAMLGQPREHDGNATSNP